MAALVVPVSGPYIGTWNSQALGTMNDDGFHLMGTFQGQEINLSDAFGMTLTEAIWRGINWRMRIRGLEFNRPGILNLIQTFGSTGAATTTLTPTLGNVGDRWSNYSKPLVLTAILGNPPTMPQTLTATQAVVAPQSNIEALMTSKMREAPFDMIFIPYYTVGSQDSTAVAFTTT